MCDTENEIENHLNSINVDRECDHRDDIDRGIVVVVKDMLDAETWRLIYIGDPSWL